MRIDFNKAVPGWKENPFVKLLHRYIGKEITEKEFNTELAYGALESIDQLKYQLDPHIPRQLMELRDLKSTPDWSKKKQEVREGIEKTVMAMDEVRDYLEKSFEIKYGNKHNLEMLKRYVAWLPADDHVSQRRVLDVIRTHDPVWAKSWPLSTRGTADSAGDATRDVSAMHKADGGNPSPVTQNGNKPEVISNVSGERI